MGKLNAAFSPPLAHVHLRLSSSLSMPHTAKLIGRPRRYDPSAYLQNINAGYHRQYEPISSLGLRYCLSPPIYASIPMRCSRDIPTAVLSSRSHCPFWLDYWALRRSLPHGPRY